MFMSALIYLCICVSVVYLFTYLLIRYLIVRLCIYSFACAFKDFSKKTKYKYIYIYINN